MPRGVKRTLDQPVASVSKKIKVSHDSHGATAGVPLTCGQGDVGQLGLGEDVMEKSRLALVDIPEPIIQVTAGGMHTVCLTETGQVYTFGCNDEGALGRDTSVEGSETVPGKVTLNVPIVMVTGGDSHTAALTDDGRVFAWGNFRDANGSIGLTSNGIEKYPIELIQEEVIVKIASGSDHLVCLTDNGEILTLGCAEQGQLGRIAEWFATRGGRKGLDLILSPGRVKAKRNRSRRLANFSDVWTGQYCTFAQDKENGDIFAWGLNNYYQLGFGDIGNRFNAERVPSFSEHQGGWQMISGGQHHSVALDSQGKVYTLGREDYGRLGLGEAPGERAAPTLVPGLRDTTCSHVAAGGCVTFAVSPRGVFSWGMGSNNQLGTGDEKDVLEPRKIEGKQMSTRQGVSVSSGGQHTVVLARNLQNGVH